MNTTETTTTAQYIAIRVGRGASIHAAELPYTKHSLCGAEGRGTSRPSVSSAGTAEVTCKRCKTRMA